MMGRSPARGFTKVDLLIVVALLIVIGILFYDTAYNAPYKTRDISCRSSLRVIGAAIISYRAAHRDQMPPGLKSLLPTLGNQSVLMCPLSGIVVSPTSIYTVRSYTYWHLSQPHAGDIICWDSGPHLPWHRVFTWLNRASRNVLYVDGRVGTLSERQFQRLGLRGVTLIQSSSGGWTEQSTASHGAAMTMRRQ